MSPAQEGPGCMVDGPQGLRGLHPRFGLDKASPSPSPGCPLEPSAVMELFPACPIPSTCHYPHGAVENFAQHGTR